MTFVRTTSILLATAGLSTAVFASDYAPVAKWLSNQFGEPVSASEVLAAPTRSSYDGCRVARARDVRSTRVVTAQCAGTALPQIILYRRSSALHRTPAVHAGSRIRVAWMQASGRFEVPGVALEDGAQGEQIRIRIPVQHRTTRARVESADRVSLVESL